MYLNIAAYHFAPLKNLPEMRVKLLAQAKELGLKGTILLTPEGINCFITGSKDAIAALLKTIRSYPELSEFKTKESWADTQPFNRMLVKIKKETISFGIPNATPLKTEAARITPKELKDWYDKNKDFVLLDTRNNFEIEVGAFKNTEHLNMKSFKDFIKAARNKLPEWKDKTIVSVCTGGIRCEKAAPFMNLLGYKNVYQLEGGILKYFEECGSEHYDGDCFVFDKRVALDPELKPSGHGMCFDCQAVLPEQDVECPSCT